MLIINNLQIRRGSVQTGFTIELPKLALSAGEVMAVRGASGCGKSTILEILGLILKPDVLDSYQIGRGDGLCEIAPQVLAQEQRTLAKLRAEYFGFMLQTGGLLPFLTVWQNITLSCDILSKTVDRQWLNNLIEQLNIGHLLMHYPRQLSIGERQRVSFLRAIAHQPAVLLADEPTAALDPKNAAVLFDIIVKLVRENHLSALIVTHDWDLLAGRDIPYIQGNVSERRAVFGS